ncbi:hypothetical protein M0P25_02315 [archaeon]|jgi:hypothetical protein|nr:hypothetical protein [archaeon]MDD2477886.1 hypothetical protein [Candidatus ainarchaeum sp.]
MAIQIEEVNGNNNKKNKKLKVKRVFAIEGRSKIANNFKETLEAIRKYDQIRIEKVIKNIFKKLYFEKTLLLLNCINSY